MESATNGRGAPGGQGGRSRAGRLVDRLRALRRESASLSRTVRFAGGAIWSASPPLTAGLLSLGLANGAAPLLQIGATRHLIDASTRPGSTLPLAWLAVLIGSMVVANLVDAGTPLLASHLNERMKLTLERGSWPTGGTSPRGGSRRPSCDFSAWATPSSSDGASFRSSSSRSCSPPAAG